MRRASAGLGFGKVSNFVVGRTVRVALCELTGVIVDLVVSATSGLIEFVVVAFDGGPGEPMVYQPVSWNLLRPAGSGFVVSTSTQDAEGLPQALHAYPVRYGGNSSRLAAHAVPTPQSARVH
jgi:hypothetical protein